MKIKVLFVLLILLNFNALAQNSRSLSGTIVTAQFELVPNVTVEVQTASGNLTTVSNAEGNFSLKVPADAFSVKFSGNNIASVTRNFTATEKTENLQIKITYVVPPVSETVTIQGDTLSPDLETRNDTVYRNFLFNRDDQLIQSLNAGINAGQHEGGGKSLEVRRFGFNTDHGGVNGGVKILVDNIQQNQGTQGHGQGYLGALKSLSGELVEDITIINGPFSAAYGDFSGLGVVQIRQKESFPNQITLRLQGGSFDTFRTFFAFSPQIKNVKSFIAYDFSYTNGPFENPLKYRRDNITGNFTYEFNEKTALGFKFNYGRNYFTSSGQIPLDLVADSSLDRFGFIDADNGGRVKLGTFGTYFRKEFSSGATFKADAFVGRSLFDLFSNFTFFLADPIYGDEIQQHDSRLQEGANVQFLQPYKLFGEQAFLTVGGNFHANQINVGLYPSENRNPNRKFKPENIDNADVLLTSAQANVNNYAGYIQNSFGFFNGHLRIEAGLRFDVFTFDVNGFELSDVQTNLIGKESAGKIQPKLAVAWSPFDAFQFRFMPITDAEFRAKMLVESLETRTRQNFDHRFYQAGTSYNSRSFSAVFSAFWIDRSNEQVYIPDDGSIEFADRSRSFGFEIRSSFRVNRFLSFNGGVTQVINAFYPGQFTADNRRIIVDSAPRTVGNAGLVVSEFKGFNASLNYRHVTRYRLDGEDRSILASGNDVVDFYLSKRLKKWVDFNVSIDNLLNKKYFETQNLFDSRTCPTCDAAARIHATPGYPFTISFGLTFRFFGKE